MIKMTEPELSRTRHKCAMALEDINWVHDAEITGSLTMDKALEEAMNGRDLGLLVTRSFEPSTESFHAWMDYAYLLTMLSNRERPFKKFSILRTGLLLNIMHKYQNSTAWVILKPWSTFLFIYLQYII